jgi:hypothetical protein
MSLNLKEAPFALIAWIGLDRSKLVCTLQDMHIQGDSKVCISVLEAIQGERKVLALLQSYIYPISLKNICNCQRLHMKEVVERNTTLLNWVY